jgi:hypothetical protein
VIEHPEFMPAELKDRPDLTEGCDRGRIYRIVARESSGHNRSSPQLSQASSKRLVEHLGSSNPWNRDTAARLLLERQDRSVAEELGVLANEGSSSVTRVQALWLLQGIGRLPRESVAAALNDPHPRVREQALLLAERQFAGDREFRDPCVTLLSDPQSDARLVFQAALSIGIFPVSDAVAPALADALVRAPDDPWLRAAVASSAASMLPDVLSLVVRHWEEDPLASSGPRPTASSIDAHVALIEQYAEIIASPGKQDRIAPLLNLLDDESLPQQSGRRRQAQARVRPAAGNRPGSASIARTAGAGHHLT